MNGTSNRRMVLIILSAFLLLSCNLLQSTEKISALQSTKEALPTQTSQNDSLQGKITLAPGMGTPTQSEQGQTTPKPGFSNALQLVGQVGGSAAAVAVRQDFAYLGQGPRFVVLDVSNPQSPTFISQSELLPGIVLGIEVDDRYAYVTTRYGGLFIFDIQQKDKPKLLSSVQPKTPGCGSLTQKEKIAYIGCNPSGLFIVDVSNPTNPEILSSNEIKGTILSIAYYANYLYLADINGPGLSIVDVADPSNPQQVGTYDVKNIPTNYDKSINAIEVCGDHLCMAVANYGLAILDLADPLNPVLSGSDSPFVPSGIVVEGDYAYLLSDLDGVLVYDISDPSHPGRVGVMPTSVGGFEFAVNEMPERGMYIANETLYIPDQTYGLTIADISTPTSPMRVGQYMTPVPDMLTGIKVSSGYAYVISRFGGFRVLDVSNPADMKEVFYDDERKNLNSQVPTAVDVIGSYAYISDANYPFHMYDISNPLSPVQVSAVYDEAASDGAHDIAISGDYAYLSGWGLQDAFYPGIGLWVIDISDPTNPQAVKFVDLPNDRWSLSIQGTTLYALDGSLDPKQAEPFSMRILDISEGANPQVVKVIPIPELQMMSPSDVFASQKELYLSTGMTSIKRYDISQPQDPVELPMDKTLIPYAYQLNLEAPYLIVNGNQVLDISDGEHPQLIGYAMEALEAKACDMVGDMLFIATNAHGVYAYRLEK
jgi:hypothetical protein